MPRAKQPILVVRSFQDKPCHCCGSTTNVWFLRFRQGSVREGQSPSEVYLRLCDECKLMLLQELEDSTNGESQTLDTNRSRKAKAKPSNQGWPGPKARSFTRRKGDHIT